MSKGIRDYIYIAKRRLRDLFADIVRVTTQYLRVVRYSIFHPREKRATSNNIYLIYTMGKVASLSVLDTITRRVPHIDTFAMHFLTPKNLERQERMLSQSGFVGNNMYRDIHTLHAKKILSCIESNPNKRIKIVTIVREPLSQIISQIFQQLNLYDIEQLRHLILDTPHIDYSYPESWCSEELQSFSGVDILEESFDRERGYSIYSNDRCDLLVIRFDAIGDIFNQAMEELSSIPNWELSRVNISSNKRYSSQYRSFKSELTVDPELIDRLYQSQYMRHFYTDNQIDQLTKSWNIIKQ